MAKFSLVLLVALFCGTAHAEDGDGRWAKRFWKASIAAVAAGSAVDIQSSLGKHETNGLLANQQGIFSMQGIGLKLEAGTGPVKTLSIDTVERPTAN